VGHARDAYEFGCVVNDVDDAVPADPDAPSVLILITYLYGHEFKWHHDRVGKLVITPERITEHEWGAKKIPSGFFSLAKR
jgi:hypothetical protein